MATRTSARQGKRRRTEDRALEQAKMYCNSREDPPGFEVKHVTDYIGNGVFAIKNFLKGEFLLQYKGELIKNQKRAKQLEKEYSDAELGCFMYYFKYKEKTMCIDATNDIFSQGRMINDAEKGDPMQNCCLKKVEVDGVPTLCTFATRNIANGEELRYDYGVPNLPWRKKYIKKMQDSQKSGNNCTKEEDNEENSPTQTNVPRQKCNIDTHVNEEDEYYAEAAHMDSQNDTPLLLYSDANNTVAEMRAVKEDNRHEATGRSNESKTAAVKDTETSGNYSEDSAEEDEEDISQIQTNVPRRTCKKPSPFDEANENCTEDSHKDSDDDTPLLHSSGIQFWGSVSIKKDEIDSDVFPMCSSVLAIGRARSNDIIVKGAADHEVIIEVNRYGQVFATNGVTKEVKHLQDKEVFYVGGRMFQWHYPVRKGQEEASEDIGNDNDSNYEQPDSGQEVSSEDIDNDNDPNYEQPESGQEETSEDIDIDDDPDYEQPDSDTMTGRNFSDDSANDEDEDENSENSKSQTNVARRTIESDILVDEDDGNSAEQAHKDRSLLLDSDVNQRSEGNNRRLNVALKKQMQNITVPTYSKKEDGKRNYRKINHCLYCERSFTSKISDHYLNIHFNEEKVKAARLLPIGSIERRKILIELENRGNFRHNVKTIERGTGELVIARRPSIKHKEKYSADSFLPCEYCLGFYLHDSLWMHMKTCLLKPETKQPSSNCVRDAQTMLSPFVKKLEKEDAKLESIRLNERDKCQPWCTSGMPE